MKLSRYQKRVTAFILLIISLNYFLGCSYYKPINVYAPNDQNKISSLKALNTQGKYFILRNGKNSYALTNPVLDETRMTLSARPEQLVPAHLVYVSHKKGAYTYLKSDGEDAVFKEVHLFSSDTSRLDTSLVYTLPLSKVQKIEIIEYDKRKSHTNTAMSIIFTVLGVALVTLIIIAATYTPSPPPDMTNTTTISSCPYISVFDGENYHLQGEIYSGSIYQSLQREDYLPLQVKAVNGAYTVKISNELPEIQHTDFADLIVVEHDKSVELLVDSDGQLVSTENPQPPESATLNRNIDVRNELLKKDNDNCFFKDDHGVRPAEELFISFKNESKNKRGKLILSGKTSSWVNYLFGEFTEAFGSYYNTWAKEQEKKPAVELEKWSNDQHIPLTISVKTPDGWKEVQKLKVVGPLMDRDMVIPVDLPGDGPAEFKISCGYLFWELDYAAIDYTPDAAFTVTKLKPYEAIDEKGNNVLREITAPDKQYLVQPDIGNAAIVQYKSVIPKEGMAQTFFLHSSGYYTQIRHYKGTPKTAFLKSFKQPGALAAFSRQKFAEGVTAITKK